jgi:DNA polymerase
MVGFFDPSETESSGFTGKSQSCISCGLYKEVLSPKIQPYGSGRRGIMNLGEAPGADEDRKGKPWQGKVGRVLRRTLRDLGIDLFEDCVNVNSVNCRPPDNRDPKPTELGCCRAQVVGPALEEHNPHVIILYGGPAVQALIGDRWNKDLGGITKWRGWTIPDRDLGAWLCPVFHPSYVERYGDEEAWTVWRQDLERAVSMADAPLPEFPDERQQVEIIHDASRLTQVLKDARGADRVAFDYETTGLKPHADGHEIVCASIATGPDEAYAFMPPEGKNRALFKRLLKDERVGKRAHNMKFEEMWSRIRIGTPVYGWEWDSMQAAHILDNRPKVTGLKFQAYVHFGVVDYNSHVDNYLKGDNQQGANSFNRVHDFIKKYGEDELLLYCGLDSLLEYKLADYQREVMGFGG